ncbi:NAD-dependent epimerase/dehydratase family protein [Chthonobacter albigriseus]|uniref:NAD-dependent epimerase/dehydratase family protein n=1 Tax=Chthonobacter albigriseus TaxID=1683161 RepID=UPI0015EF2AFA|nr:SDR family oxidoreductase [Chthonobacter albigriseus]
MRILITGNMGYVGPIVARHLRTVMPHAHITGLDSGLFAHCLTSVGLPERVLDEQLFMDVRDVKPELLDGYDAVVELAAVSNDPMGNRFEAVTDDINCRAAVRIAEMAVARGVKKVVFASSCSIYGAAEGGAKKETDSLAPLTAYARSKVATEQALAQMDRGNSVVTALRFATACGFSDRLRLDLVLNDFVACALVNGQIQVMSDGTPWRPLIHVADMARAIEWAITRDKSQGGDYLAVNVGTDVWNYQVKDLAEAVAKEVPGTTVTINLDAPADKRSYKVDFSLYRQIAPQHQPRVMLADAVRDLRSGLTAYGLADKDFRTNPHVIRLRTLQRWIDEGRLSDALRWTNPEAPITAAA